MRVSNSQQAARASARQTLRCPTAADGARVHALIAACPPLEENSLYCNLLQCTHFAASSIVAEQGGRLVGWISGYRLPADPARLFIWQVAVDAAARGTGLGRRMLLALLARPALAGVRWLETTVSPDNAASRALFRSLARCTGASLAETTGFERDAHFGGRHASEPLLVIGPMNTDLAPVPEERHARIQ